MRNNTGLMLPLTHSAGTGTLGSMLGDTKGTLTASSFVVAFALIALLVWWIVVELAGPAEALDCGGVIASLEKVVEDSSVSKAAHDMTVVDLREARAACGQG